MKRVQTDIPILKNRRAVYVLSIGIVLATLSLVAGWLFTREAVYMNYAPQPRRNRMPLQEFGDGFVAELPGSFRARSDEPRVFRTQWGEEVRFWIPPRGEIGLGDPQTGGHVSARDWLDRLNPDGEVLACRPIRHPLGFGAEVLWRTEEAYIHEVAIVEGAENRGAFPVGARLLRLRMQVPRRRYGTFRPLLIQMLSTLEREAESAGEPPASSPDGDGS